MFELYGMASPNVTKIRLMLEELHWPYEFHWVQLFREAQFSPAFRALNPNGKVPVLLDHAPRTGAPLKLFESGAILLYLAEKSGRFLPLEDVSRYIVMQWLMLQLTGIGPMFGQHTHFKFFAPTGNDYSLARYTREVRRYYGVLNHRLSEAPYFGGDEYSVADINLLPWVALFERQDIDLEEFSHVQRWFQLLNQRPAVQKTFALTKDLMERDAGAMASAPAETIQKFIGVTEV